MKIIGRLLIAVFIGLVSGSCRDTVRSDPVELAGAMKGVELYSWQVGGEWTYALLVGTNREKTLDEIKSPGTMIHNVDTLLSELDTFTEGQYVTWILRETLVYPPDDIVNKVEQVCAEHGLILNYVEWP